MVAHQEWFAGLLETLCTLIRPLRTHIRTKSSTHRPLHTRITRICTHYYTFAHNYWQLIVFLEVWQQITRLLAHFTTFSTFSTTFDDINAFWELDDQLHTFIRFYTNDKPIHRPTFRLSLRALRLSGRASGRPRINGFTTEFSYYDRPSTAIHVYLHTICKIMRPSIMQAHTAPIYTRNPAQEAQILAHITILELGNYSRL